MTGVWHLDLDLDMVMNLAWIFPEVLRSDAVCLESVKLRIQCQFSSDKLCQDGVVVGWGGVGVVSS